MQNIRARSFSLHKAPSADKRRFSSLTRCVKLPSNFLQRSDYLDVRAAAVTTKPATAPQNWPKLSNSSSNIVHIFCGKIRKQTQGSRYVLDRLRGRREPAPVPQSQSKGIKRRLSLLTCSRPKLLEFTFRKGQE